jgi:Holliday junction resolvase-like predicted endonuclease
MLSFLQGWFAPSRGTAAKDPLGDRGENHAARYLRERGYKILLRNFRCPLGEIDIVARDGRTLVFVEVKTRTEDEPLPEDQVNPFKQHQLTKPLRRDRRRLARGPRARRPPHAARVRGDVLEFRVQSSEFSAEVADGVCPELYTLNPEL